MAPRLTRRGWAVVGIAVAAFLMAYLFGPRALDALIVPLVLSVIAAGIATFRARRPTYRRVLPENGHVGQTRTVRLNFDVETPEAGVVHDAVGEGLRATGNRVEATIGNDPVEYEVTFTDRGVHTIGPLEVSVRDVLGLAETSFEYPEVDEVVAYPPVRPLTGATREELNLLAGGAPERERDEFHRLREYTTGDSLRDVHWKTSAKQPDDELVVKDFVADDEFGEVRIRAEGPERYADELAEAAASVAVNLLDRGVDVGLTIGYDSIAPSTGPDHRARLLELLARTDFGEVNAPESEEVDVELLASGDGVVVRMGDHETSFDALVGTVTADGESTTRVREVVSA